VTDRKELLAIVIIVVDLSLLKIKGKHDLVGTSGHHHPGAVIPGTSTSLPRFGRAPVFCWSQEDVRTGII
jgi:hypothetical protein